MAVAVLVGVSGLVAVVVVGLIGLLPLIAAAALAVTAVLALDDVTRGLPELQAQFPWAGALSVLSPVMSFLLAVGAAGALAIGFGSEIDSAGVLALRCFAAVAAAAIPLVSALPVISYLRMIRALLKGLARSQAQAATGRALWAVIASAAAFPFLIVFLLVTVHSERLTLGVALSLPCVCVILLLIALAAIHREVGDLLREATIAEDMKATAAPH